MRDKKIRTQIYLSMLDMSFKRTGACIGYCGNKDDIEASGLIADDDMLEYPHHSKKTVFFERLISGRKFHQLPRKLREELLAVDGATIITVDGTILAVGAILKLRGGSSGGGRTAAAKALSAFGLGVKVSNDGKIEYWNTKSEDPIHTIG